MRERISRLMDGELDDAELDAACGDLKGADGVTVWACYHVIGDTLRGDEAATPGFARRFAARLAAEPTVLAPRTRESRPVTFAWAAAATVAAVAVVGWIAVTTLDTPLTSLAKARGAGSVRVAQAKVQAVAPDYLLAHQEYSPATSIQGVGPYLRAVTAPGPEAQP